MIPIRIDAKQTVNNVKEHLYEHEFRKWQDQLQRPKHKQKGRIRERIESIQKNVSKPGKLLPKGHLWNRDDEIDYTRPGDVTKEIKDKKERKDKFELPQAAELLRKHYGELFRIEDRIPSRAELEDQQCYIGLLALHDAVRDNYRHLFTRDRQNGTQLILPKDFKALYRLVISR